MTETIIHWEELVTTLGIERVNSKKMVIMDAAYRIIHDIGLQNLTVTELSKRTKLSKSLILYHFESIDKLIESMFYHASKQARYHILRATEEKNNFEERILGIIEGVLNWVIFNPTLGEFFILMYHESSKSESMLKIHRDFLENANQIFERVFFESMRYTDLNLLKSAVTGLNHLITGTMFRVISCHDYDNLEEHLSILCQNIEKLLDIELPAYKSLLKGVSAEK